VFNRVTAVFTAVRHVVGFEVNAAYFQGEVGLGTVEVVRSLSQTQAMTFIIFAVAWALCLYGAITHFRKAFPKSTPPVNKTNAEDFVDARVPN
jgi:hypothetical protein